MYYRLKQTDFNGKTTKTDWYSVNVELTNDVVIYPNPVNDELKIKFNNGISNTDIKIYDITGKIIYETNYNDINGVGEIDIDLTNVPKGLYLVEILNNLYKLEHN